MAPPVFSGLTRVVDISQLLLADINRIPADTLQSAFINSGEYHRLRSVQYNSNTLQLLEVNFNEPTSGTSYDLTNKVFQGTISSSIPAATFMRVGLRSGTTPGDNYITYRINASTTLGTEKQFAIDCTIEPDNSVGTFDITDVTAFILEWQHTANQGNREIRLWSDYFIVDRNAGLIFTEGDSVTPVNFATIEDFFSNANGNYYETGVAGSLASSLNTFAIIPYSITLGDGITPSVFSFEAGSALIPRLNSLPNASNQATLKISASRLTVNSEESKTFQTLILAFTESSNTTTLIGGIPFTHYRDFYDVSVFVNEYPGFLARNTGDLFLGISNYTGSLQSVNGFCTAGGNLTLEFTDINNTYAHNWSNTTSYINCVWNSPGSDYFINIDDTIPGVTINDGDTLDLSQGVTFSSSIGVNKIRVNVPGKTINILAGNSGVLESDIDVISGTINFVQPSFVLQLLNIPLGSEVRIYDLDSAVAGNLGTELAGIEFLVTATFIYNYTGSGNVIWIQVLSSGFLEFGQSITLPPNNLDFDVNLELEENA